MKKKHWSIRSEIINKMELLGVPQENLRKAQLMRAELLFKTNKHDII